MPDFIYDNVRPLRLTEADLQNGPALLRMMGIFGVPATMKAAHEAMSTGQPALALMRGIPMLPDTLGGLPMPPPSARSAVHVHLHVAAGDDGAAGE